MIEWLGRLDRLAHALARVALLGLLAPCMACGENRSEPTPTPAPAPPTYARDVAPIIHAQCSPCHHDGGPGPFVLLDYEHVVDHAEQIVEVTHSGYMPPWLPREGYGRFAGERRLSMKSRQVLADWVAGGRQPGDLARAPKPPTFTHGWQLGEPDLVLRAEAVWELPADGPDVYRNFVIAVPPGPTRFVKTVELRPGSPRVVHHAVMRIDSEGEARRLDLADPESGFAGMVVGGARMPGGNFVGWTPGKTPYAGTDERAWQLAGGSDLVVQVHVRPTGKVESILPEVGIHFATQPPSKAGLALVLSSTDIDIAPGDANYEIVDSLELPADVLVSSVYPHAHFVAKTIESYATLPDGRREWLIKIDNWDFDWQDQYRFAVPIELPKGSVITMRHVYDNSASNPRNPSSPPQRVQFGPNSTDEMAELILEVEPRNPADLQVLDDALEARWLAVQIATAQRALASAPGDMPTQARARANLASLLAHAGRADEAKHEYEAALALHDDPSTRVDYSIVLAGLAQLEAAEAQLDAALRLAPEHARAHLVRGNRQRGAGQLDAALISYRRALAADPELIEAHNNLGATYEQLEHYDSAALSFAQAIALAPGRAQLHENHARALEAAGRYDDALAAYRAALERDGGSIRALRGLAWLLATHPDARARDPQQAIRFAQAGGRLTGFRSPELLEALAAGLAADGQFAPAREAIARAIELAQVVARDDLVERYRAHDQLFARGEPVVLEP
jgi:tetratricopeptide (TPR) repeat protein